MRRWILERGRISCQRQSYTELSGCWAQRCIACESEGIRLRLEYFENVRQRTWDYIPKRDCMWDSFQQIFLGNRKTFYKVVMRHTCQVTNQSSHGEPSFHHNPHLLLCRGLCLSTFRVIRRGGTRLKNAAHPSYCHCCELCALKQKPGVLLDKFSKKTNQIPTANRTHHRIRSPSIKCSGT